MDKRMIVGLAHGDVNGVGYELIVKMMADNRICEVCTPLLFGSSKVAAYHRKTLNIENFTLNSIQKAEEANAKRCNIINCVDDGIKVDLGQETEESDAAAMLALQVGLDALDRKEIDVLVGAPMGSAAFRPAKSCLEYMAQRYNARNVMPLLVGGRMKMGFVTYDLPLKEVSGNITFNNVYYRLKLVDSCLRRNFTVLKPTIAVLGLNPHAGETAMYGEEEKNVIIPAIEKARENGIMAMGPYSPETLFSGTGYEKFDVILAMYHDQGVLPFKAVEGNGGAVLLAGLPVICTTPAHGMAYDIVGKGTAEEEGMRNALYLAMDVYANRSMNAELVQNPLRHYDIASNSNESDLNVEQIAGVREEPEA